jgi:hypothetical protein
MSFPPKKLPEQRLSGYIADNLTLIEGYLNSSVGASALIRLIFESTGLKVSLPVFHNALYRARKKAHLKHSPASNAVHTPRTTIAPSSTSPKSLREIMNEPLDLTQYPRKFTRKDT